MAMSTLHFISLFAGLVHHGTLILLLDWSVLLFAAAALCLAWSFCQSDSTSRVSLTEIVGYSFDCARPFHFNDAICTKTSLQRFSDPAHSVPA
ncbi:transmembrane protein, putative [Medicago truncatula]|uniref:Transmembrane protein, putative n=1 Tax=Medicago truncatula TaxID=3880 RepID=G7L4M3_MEDTR|nr:transmembrane protein, putative [Medicago truncatula]